MTHSTLNPSTTLKQGPLPRWLFVAAAVGVIGVGIDLRNGPSANARSMPASQISVLAALPQDHTRVASLADEGALEPGASVAAYGVADEGVASAPAAPLPADGPALEPGASVAAYGG